MPWDWDAEARALGASSSGRFNAGAIELTAPDTLVWSRSQGSTLTLSGSDLVALSGEYAAALASLGVGRDDRVAGLMGRRPDVFAVAMAVWRLGAVYVPLFSGFGGEGLRVRLEDSGPRVAVVDSANLAGVGAVRNALPGLTVLVVDGPAEAGDASFDELRGRSLPVPGAAETGLHDPSTIMYTSGTTGRPKGCVMPHRAIVSLIPYVRHCLAVGPGDRLFSGADAGWSFGLFTTGLAPMAIGASRVVYEGPFSASGWWTCVDEVGASHIAAPPTAFRQLAAVGAHVLPGALRAATSAGEPMDAATVAWFTEHAGVVIHDSYGLSELGMIVANLRCPPGVAVAPGSMGVPLPGFEVRLLDDDGVPVEGEDQGRLAVADNGFLLSSGYWQRQQEWDARVVDGWFLTEDVARRDHEGRYWYVGRADDVIVTAGYNVGPSEVESALIEHPLVVDAACVGAPDALKGQVVVAHVVLNGADPGNLIEVLRSWVGERVGWHAAPRRVEVCDELPRTASGKVRRNVLRGQGAR